MRPYTVLGKTYYPTKVSIGDSFSGIASWYGPNFHNKLTSNGEYYNMYAMTAAHKTLPMNTMLKVTNLENGKVAIVRINDRGPFVKNRIIDLSNEAAHKIDMVKKGTAPVRIEVIGFDGVIGQYSKTKSIVMDNYFVQIGAFRNKDGARRYASKYKLVDDRYTSGIKEGVKDGVTLYRVYLKGFKSENEARDFIALGKFAGAYILRE
jgi:rare lipoprotein A